MDGVACVSASKPSSACGGRQIGIIHVTFRRQFLFQHTRLCGQSFLSGFLVKSLQEFSQAKIK
jgi:hypothetical protein